MPEKYIYRPKNVWVYLAVIAILGASASISFFVAGMVHDALLSISNSICAGIVSWIFVVSPKIVFEPNGIQIYNPLTIYKIGWQRTVDFRTRFAFTVVTEKRQYSAWAAPAPNRFISKRIHETDFKGTGLEDRKVISPSDSPRSESGVALILALKHREQFKVNSTQGYGETRHLNRTSFLLMTCMVGLSLLNFV